LNETGNIKSLHVNLVCWTADHNLLQAFIKLVISGKYCSPIDNLSNNTFN